MIQEEKPFIHRRCPTTEMSGQTILHSILVLVTREHPKLNMISDRFYTVIDSGTLYNEGDLLNLTCNELDKEADIVAPAGFDSADAAKQDALKALLQNGTAKGFYKILDKQSDCLATLNSHAGEKVLSKPTLVRRSRLLFYLSACSWGSV